MLVKKIFTIVTYCNGVIVSLAFFSALMLLLSFLKILPKNQPLSGFIALMPPITGVLLFCFSISSVILVFVFIGILSDRWLQLNHLFWLNSLYIIYTIIHFYFIGFIIPKLSS